MKLKASTLRLLAAALFAAGGMSSTMAQGTQTPRIDQAQQAIGERIRQGMASGHITPSEAQVLYRRDREIQVREGQYKSRGVVTAQDREELRSDLDGLQAEVERMIANRDVVRPPGSGATQTPGINNRQYNASQRIEEGMRLGRITPREERRLLNREREIARMEDSYKADGVVTPQERRQLREELAVLEGEIERLMRNERRGRSNEFQSSQNR